MSIRIFGSRALIPLILVAMGLAGWHAVPALGQMASLPPAGVPQGGGGSKASSLDSSADAYIEQLGDDDRASQMASTPVRRIHRRPVRNETQVSADEQAASDTATAQAADRASNLWIIGGALATAGLAGSVFVAIWALKPRQRRKQRHVAEVLVLEMARNSTGSSTAGRGTTVGPTRRAA